MLEATLAMIIAIPIFAVIVIIGFLVFRATIKAFFQSIAEKYRNFVRKIALKRGQVDDLLTDRIKDFMERKIIDQIINNSEGIEKICADSKTNKAAYDARRQEYILKCVHGDFSLNGTDTKDLKLLNKIYIAHLKLDLVFDRLSLFLNENYFIPPANNPTQNVLKKVKDTILTNKKQKYSMAYASFFEPNRQKLAQAQYRTNMSITEKMEALRATLTIEKKTKDPNLTIVEGEFQRVTDSLQQMIGKEGERMRQKFMHKYYRVYKPDADVTKKRSDMESIFFAKVQKPNVGTESGRVAQLRKYLMIYCSAFVKPELRDDFAAIATRNSKVIFPALIGFSQVTENPLVDENFTLLEKKFLDKKQLMHDIFNLLDVSLFKDVVDKKSKRKVLMVRESAMHNLAEVLPYMQYYLNLSDDFVKNVKQTTSARGFLYRLAQNFSEDSLEYNLIYLPLQEKYEKMISNIEDRVQLNRMNSIEIDDVIADDIYHDHTKQKTAASDGMIKKMQDAKEMVEDFLHVGKPGEEWRESKKLEKLEERKMEAENERTQEEEILKKQQKIKTTREETERVKNKQKTLKRQTKFDERARVDLTYVEERYNKTVSNKEWNDRNKQIFLNLYTIFFKEKFGVLHVRRTPNKHLLEAIHKNEIGIMFTAPELEQIKQRRYMETESIKTGLIKWKKEEKNRQEFFAIFLEILRQKFCDQNNIIIDQEKYEQIYISLFNEYCTYYNVIPATEMILHSKEPADNEENEDKKITTAANCNDQELNIPNQQNNAANDQDLVMEIGDIKLNA